MGTAAIDTALAMKDNRGYPTTGGVATVSTIPILRQTSQSMVYWNSDSGHTTRAGR